MVPPEQYCLIRNRLTSNREAFQPRSLQAVSDTAWATCSGEAAVHCTLQTNSASVQMPGGSADSILAPKRPIVMYLCADDSRCVSHEAKLQAGPGRMFVVESNRSYLHVLCRRTSCKQPAPVGCSQCCTDSWHRMRACLEQLYALPCAGSLFFLGVVLATHWIQMHSNHLLASYGTLRTSLLIGVLELAVAPQLHLHIHQMLAPSQRYRCTFSSATTPGVMPMPEDTVRTRSRIQNAWCGEHGAPSALVRQPGYDQRSWKFTSYSLWYHDK